MQSPMHRHNAMEHHHMMCNPAAAAAAAAAAAGYNPFFANPIAATYAAQALMLHQQLASTPMRQPQGTPMRAMGSTPQTQSRAPKTTAARERTPAKVPTVQGDKLAEDLRYASKDDLIELLIELAANSAEAKRFIECKSQLFQLRSSEAMDFSAPRFDDITPVKQRITDSDAIPSFSPGTPGEMMLADPTIAPEQRPFCAERHPCVMHDRACRNPKSCLFTQSPMNLCTAFVRGDCPNGAKCALVHRLPPDASPAIRHLYDVKTARQQERTTV